jgi:hypothetical protein
MGAQNVPICTVDVLIDVGPDVRAERRCARREVQGPIT